jgi:hypothetical protein
MDSPTVEQGVIYLLWETPPKRESDKNMVAHRNKSENKKNFPEG